jgi:uncharacterized protein YigE (DUF2233 family)
MTEEVQNQAAAPAEAQTQVKQEAPAADLNISDLAALKSIIEVASQRGAFKANELEAVGKTFNKLNNFLESVAKKEA